MRYNKKILNFIVLLAFIVIIVGISAGSTSAATIANDQKVKQNQTLFDLKSVPKYDKQPYVEVRQ